MPQTSQRTEASINRADQCRRLARGALPYAVVRQLEEIAAEYESAAPQPFPRQQRPIGAG